MRVHLFVKSSWPEKEHLAEVFELRAVMNSLEIVQFGPNLSTGEMYDQTQCDEKFKDGDLFVCNSGKTVGFLSKAWPVAIYGETGSLHLAAETIWNEYPDVKFKAEMLAAGLEPSTEATAKQSDPEYY